MGGRRRALLRGVAVAALAIISLLGPAGAPPAFAADDALSLVSTSSYSLIPDKALVHVTVDVTATNNKPDKVQETPSGTLTTRYFYDAAGIVIHTEAVAIRASAGKTKLATKVTPADGYSVLQVSFQSNLNYKKSTKFRVDYDLPGGAPRSDSEIRVGPAFATFYAWAFGDRGDVRVVIPAGFEVETTGSTIGKSAAGGVTTLTATGIGDPAQWFAIVVADRHDALTQDRLDLAGGEHVVIRAWPEDTEWRTKVRDLLRRGLPVLVEKIGLDWPVEGDIEVAEVHTPLLEGYGGVFYTDENRIEISEDLDELTIIHEASHAWFNSNLFDGRWINEGFADEYASRVLDVISTGGLGYDPVAPDSDGHVRLNAWLFPGRIADAATEATERFGYAASWRTMRALVRNVGEEGFRKVIKAASEGQVAYVGAGTPEQILSTTDWRRFLDLLEEVGGSTTAETQFRQWVVTSDEEALLDERLAARTAYAALTEAGKDWRPGFVIRDPMGRWQFERAAREMGRATEVLAVRDQIVARAADLGVAPPSSLRAAYEGATDLDDVRELAAAQLATATAVDAAAERVTAERDVFTALGLIGEDPAASVAAAAAAFSAGDSNAANAGAASTDTLMTGAADTGRTRALVAGAGGAGLLAVGAGAAAMRRRRGHAGGPPVAESPAAAPIEPEPYATLGDPRPAKHAAGGPSESGRDEGDDT